MDTRAIKYLVGSYLADTFGAQFKDAAFQILQDSASPDIYVVLVLDGACFRSRVEVCNGSPQLLIQRLEHAIRDCAKQAKAHKNPAFEYVFAGH